jgi:glycogen phosphorylase
LESDIVPAFYEQGTDGLPRRWISYMKSSIGTLSYSFNTHRMVKDYTKEFYSKAHERSCRLMADNAEGARQLASWLSRIERAWANVAVEAVDGITNGETHIGHPITVRARIRLGGLTPGEVAVQLYLGRLNADGEITDAEVIPMQPAPEAHPDGSYLFEARDIPCRRSGLNGYTVRILPFHADEAQRFLPGRIRWANEAAVKTSMA